PASAGAVHAGANLFEHGALTVYEVVGLKLGTIAIGEERAEIARVADAALLENVEVAAVDHAVVLEPLDIALDHDAGAAGQVDHGIIAHLDLVAVCVLAARRNVHKVQLDGAAAFD